MSISNYLEEAWLKTIRGNSAGTTFTAPASVYIKLHTGDPGEDGTSNAAGETTRKSVTFAAPSNPGGTMVTSADLTWTAVSTAETYSYVSLWDNSTAGNCLWSGLMVDPADMTTPATKTVAAGDTFTIASGKLQVTLS